MHLKRFFGHSEVPLFDSLLMLDDFRQWLKLKRFWKVSLLNSCRDFLRDVSQSSGEINLPPDIFVDNKKSR